MHKKVLSIHELRRFLLPDTGFEDLDVVRCVAWWDCMMQTTGTTICDPIARDPMLDGPAMHARLCALRRRFAPVAQAFAHESALPWLC